jgi:GT2 family glycosyltransferase
VDNASTDNSLGVVENRWPEVRVIRMEKNVGFAAANNAAAHVAKGRWLALLNPDAFPAPDWFQALLTACETHPSRYFFASCQIQADNPNLLDGTGDQYSTGGIAWRRHHGRLVDEVPQLMDEVFSACGASAFYPRDAYLSVGGFDESFFSYLEDIDLGFRLRLSGYRCLYVPQARVFHVGSASLGVNSEFAIYHSLRNLVWVYFKNMPAPYFWKFFPVHLMTSIGYSLYYAFCCCPCVSLRAAKDALLGLPSILDTRKKIQANLQVVPDEVIRIIKNPFRRKSYRFGFFLLLPKLVFEFAFAVKKCREQQRGEFTIASSSTKSIVE